MRIIECRINGVNMQVEAEKLPAPKEWQRGKWGEDSHNVWERRTDNIWPWRYMEAGERVVIPYTAASYPQMQNSINGFTRHSYGAKFRYRSDALGLIVWCVKARRRVKK